MNAQTYMTLITHKVQQLIRSNPHSVHNIKTNSKLFVCMHLYTSIIKNFTSYSAITLNYYNIYNKYEILQKVLK